MTSLAARLLLPALIGVVALLPFSPAMAGEPRTVPIPIFLSTDLGCEIDDQWPLLHLLGDPRFDLRVIATAQAPADAVPSPPADVSAKLARHILRDRLDLTEPPAVVAGSNLPLIDGRTPRHSRASNALLDTSRAFGPDNRLTVLVIGAATDVASALLQDATLANRIRIVAMGFRSPESGDEFNIKNDPHAWRVILASDVPVTVGDGSVTSRRLSLTRDEAKALLDGAGPLGAWLLRDYESWYARVTTTFQNPGRPAGPPSWPIWDEVVVADLLGKTRSEVRPRPMLEEDMKLVPGGRGTIRWITEIDRDAIFSEFRSNLLRLAQAKDLVDRDCITIARDANACWHSE